jgi:alkanesulfonate monooxygenase SsuD/methylene tetrahydromethanopterin reductase-like flavin-dependent oxidoreductase (luciferase family)
MARIDTTIQFDMRAPDWATPPATLYAEALAMAAYADEIGVDRIGLCEHHGSEDGYLPSPFVMGGGIAARTERVRIALGALVLPLHDPVKVAERIAVLDLMSNGRLDVILGVGYVPSEFPRFRVSMRDRGKLLDQGIDILLRALRGERFEADGREVFVRPLPVQEPEAILLAGGGVEATARRAARFGIGLAPLSSGLLPVYTQECTKHGRALGKIYGFEAPLGIHIAEDPDQGWARIEPHVVHAVTAYARWAAEAGWDNAFRNISTPEQVRASGLYPVWTPDEVVANASVLMENHNPLNFAPLVGGLSPDVGWESLELLKNKVMPRLRELNAHAS